MSCHIRPCLCCSVTTGTKIAAILIAVGSCFLIIGGVVCLVESQQIAVWWKNAGEYLISQIPNAEVTPTLNEENEEALLKALTYETVILGWEILIAGVSGIVLAGIIYFGAMRFRKYRNYNATEETLPA